MLAVGSAGTPIVWKSRHRRGVDRCELVSDSQWQWRCRHSYTVSLLTWITPASAKGLNLSLAAPFYYYSSELVIFWQAEEQVVSISQTLFRLDPGDSKATFYCNPCWWLLLHSDSITDFSHFSHLLIWKMIVGQKWWITPTAQSHNKTVVNPTASLWGQDLWSCVWSPGSQASSKWDSFISNWKIVGLCLSKAFIEIFSLLQCTNYMHIFLFWNPVI